MNEEQKRQRVYELMKRHIWVDGPIDVVTWTADGEETLLHIASSMGYMEAVKLLVELGANVNALGDLNHTPLHFAALRDHDEIYNYLLEHGADPNFVSQLAVTPAGIKRDMKVAKEKWADIEADFKKYLNGKIEPKIFIRKMDDFLSNKHGFKLRSSELHDAIIKLNENLSHDMSDDELKVAIQKFLDEKIKD